MVRLTRRQVVTCALALLAFACQALVTEPALADSEMRALPGQVMFIGDGSQHRLEVWDSSVDLAARDWRLEGAPDEFGAGASQGALDTRDLASAVSNFPFDGSDPDGSRLREETAVALAAMTSGLSGELLVRMNELRAAVDRALAIKDQMDRATAIRDEVFAFIESLLQGGRRAEEVKAELNAITQAWKLRIADLTAQANQEISRTAAAMDAVLDLTEGSSPAFQKKVTAKVNGIVGALIGVGRSGAATIEALAYLSDLFIIADVGLSIYSMTSDDAVIVQDTTGNPVQGRWPCRNVVRSTTGEQIPDAVSCPAPHLPAYLSWFHPFTTLTALYVKSGGADDTISLRLGAERNPFAEVYVEGGGGNDTIEGSYFGERLIGGPGNDTIKGRLGNDVIYGDNIFVNWGVDAATANDVIFAGAGDDVVQGDLGDDLIFGGRGDDWSWAGAGLSGGAGNDAIVGGPGRDELDGGRGRDSIFARESDFPVKFRGPSDKQADEYDYLVNCGYSASDTAPEYVTVSSITDSSGNLETDDYCQGPPRTVPSIEELVAARPRDGRWPWFG